MFEQSPKKINHLSAPERLLAIYQATGHLPGLPLSYYGCASATDLRLADKWEMQEMEAQLRSDPVERQRTMASLRMDYPEMIFVSEPDPLPPIPDTAALAKQAGVSVQIYREIKACRYRFEPLTGPATIAVLEAKALNFIDTARLHCFTDRTNQGAAIVDSARRAGFEPYTIIEAINEGLDAYRERIISGTPTNAESIQASDDPYLQFAYAWVQAIDQCWIEQQQKACVNFYQRRTQHESPIFSELKIPLGPPDGLEIAIRRRIRKGLGNRFPSLESYIPELAPEFVSGHLSTAIHGPHEFESALKTFNKQVSKIQQRYRRYY
ncbi:hypothetical protein [Acaryochloris marina]|uniref:Uncharacterized protein n=1 Tax=Acaryochloris marina (strain MBIC 11017) TaxID=329726 RepID=B0C8S9_ACAM1|nr:hypothetical protein [Acaryochloris marina]ABW25319.1 hypothetical protein AM1_0233 [Acaryochloris marina MBIC11017]